MAFFILFNGIKIKKSSNKVQYDFDKKKTLLDALFEALGTFIFQPLIEHIGERTTDKENPLPVLHAALWVGLIVFICVGFFLLFTSKYDPFTEIKWLFALSLGTILLFYFLFSIIKFFKIRKDKKQAQIDDN